MDNEKWAIITGSSRGLGLEIALSMASAGFRTVISGRNQDAIYSAIKKINAISHIEHKAVCIDLAEEDSGIKLYNQIKDLNISPSVIVNNLGGGVAGDSGKVSVNILRKSLRLNLEVGIELNNLFYDDLKANSGVIVHIGSTASMHFNAPSCYVITKTALNAYIKNAARSFAKDNISIFALLPGMLEHDGSYINRLNNSDPEKYNQFLSESVFNRFTSSSETAQFILKIIEARTTMINGALIQFDGGKE